MPNGNKRRPDTLELEVLRASTPARQTSRTQSPVPQRPAASTKPRRYASVDNEQQQPRATTATAATTAPTSQPPSTFPNSTPLTSVDSRSRRWYHFGGMFSRNAASNTATTTTSTANLEAATATLAKPEPSTIDNSTATILTLSPHNADDNLPDVAAVQPRQQQQQQPQQHQGSFKRRSHKSRSGSLYSLATLAQTGEVQLHSRSNSCNKFKDKEAELEAEAALMYDEQVAKAKEKTLLTSSCQPPSFDNVDEITDTIGPETKSGLRANLMSFLSKLGIWKNSNCRPPRKRSSLRSKHTTPSGYSATGASSSLTGRKSVTLSCEFEQFPAGDTGDEKTTGRLANAKELGKRRLSQMRRRRSSYYFSGIYEC